MLRLADENPGWSVGSIASEAVVSRHSAWNVLHRVLHRHRPGRVHTTTCITTDSETPLVIEAVPAPAAAGVSNIEVQNTLDNAEEDNGEEIMTPEDANIDLDALYADYAAAVAAGMFEDTLVEAPVMVIPPAEATILDVEYADILEMVTEMSMRPAKAAIQDIVLDVEALEAPVMVIPPAEATILDVEYADILEMVTEMSMRPAKAAIQDIVLDVEALEAPVMVIPPAEVFSQADILDIERCKALNEATGWAEYKTWWERTGNYIDEPFEKVRARAELASVGVDTSYYYSVAEWARYELFDAVLMKIMPAALDKRSRDYMWPDERKYYVERNCEFELIDEKIERVRSGGLLTADQKRIGRKLYKLRYHEEAPL